MVAANKFQGYVESIAEKKIDSQADQFTIALTMVLPPAAAQFRSSLTEISYVNLSSRDVVTLSSAQTGGLYKLVLQSLTISATGPVATWRYATLYDRASGAAATDALVDYLDTGIVVGITMAAGQTVSFNFSATDGVVQIAG